MYDNSLFVRKGNEIDCILFLQNERRYKHAEIFKAFKNHSGHITLEKGDNKVEIRKKEQEIYSQNGHVCDNRGRGIISKTTGK